MSTHRGALGDDRHLSERARAYANEVVRGEKWPITDEHVDLSRVTFETSTRMQRRHGVCQPDGDGGCIVRLSAKTADRAGFEAIEETIRHELVHVMQFQAEDLQVGHGPSFREWVPRLELAGRCNTHYEVEASDYRYRFHCPNCGFVGGRYRLCKTVRAAVAGELRCGSCESDGIVVRTDDGVLEREDIA